MKAKLKVYELRYLVDVKEWMLFTGDGHMVWPSGESTKATAIEWAVTDMKDMLDYGQGSELRIRNKNGRYSPARTYGPDPRKSRG